MRFRRVIFTVLFALAAVLLQADLILAPTPLQVFRNTDENWYGIVMNRLETMSCEQGIPVTFLFPERKGFHTCEYFKVLNSISPFHDPIHKVIFLKSLARVLTLAAYCGLTFMVLGSALPGILLGLWHFLDPGLESFKPLVTLISQTASGTPPLFTQSARLISPLHYLLPGFALILCFIWLIRNQNRRHENRKSTRWKITALSLPVFFWLLAMTPFYSWLPILYILGCLVLYAWYFSERFTKVLLTSALVLGSGLILWEVHAKNGVLFESEVLPRVGFRKHCFEPIFFAHKGLIVASLLLAAMAYGVFKKRFLPALLVGGGLFLLVNINMVTGFEYQNYHFKDYLGPFYLGSIFLFLLWKFPQRRRWVLGIALLVSVVGSYQYVKAQTSLPNGLATAEKEVDHDAILSFARAHLEGKRVFCNLWNFELPLRANVHCYWHHLMMAYPISDLELLEMSIVQFKLQGLTRAQVEKLFAEEYSHPTLAVWSYGVKPEWIAGVPENERYRDGAALQKFIPKWLDAYEKFPQSRLREVLSEFDYLILKRSHPEVASALKVVQEFSEYGIYEPIAGI